MRISETTHQIWNVGLRVKVLEVQVNIHLNTMYDGKSLNNRNFVLKCTESYAQRKILFRYTKWLLSNTLLCSSTVQVDSGAAMLYQLLRRLILLDRHDP
jgi:hypothetical protein